MEMRKIGSLDVSVVGLGCNNFGRRLDPDATARVLDAAIDSGINFFDTADIYGGTLSEEYMGRALKGKRDKAILATKFGMEVSEDKKGAHPRYIRHALDDSLRRLQMDYVDLYQLHTPDAEVPISDTLGALNELVKAGKIREIGCSNFSAKQLREAQTAAAGGTRFVSVQNEYSLLHREPEAEVLPECQQLDVAFLPFFPLASGLLSGKYRQGEPAPKGTRLDSERGAAKIADHLATVEKLANYCESRGHTLLSLAFSWLVTHPMVASVIAGATSAEQIRSNVAACSWKLSDQELAEVNEILS